MSDPTYLLTIAAQRQAELVAAAEQNRLARQVKRAVGSSADGRTVTRAARRPSRRRWLANLGRRRAGTG